MRKLITRYFYGHLGEFVAKLLLLIKFYNIISSRNKLYQGEIDIIATRGNLIVFVEVKLRQEGLCHEIISDKQINRIRKAAEYFLARNKKYQQFDVRFDLIAISSNLLQINHIKNAF